MLNTGIRTEGDFALSLLGEYTENKSVPLKTSASMGLTLAYAGSHREDLLAYLLPHVADDTITMETSGLALGFIFVGNKNGDANLYGEV
jgi:26S proteasome regulatory subunit N1